jgi:catalase
MKRVDGNFRVTKGFEPNSLGEWQEQPDFRPPQLSLEGPAHHWNQRVDEDDYSRPGPLFRLKSPAQQQALFENTARWTGMRSHTFRFATYAIARGRYGVVRGSR